MKAADSRLIRILFLFIVVCSLFIAVYYLLQRNGGEIMQSHSNTVRFMPIGDSYTIGNGLKIEERWPNLLVQSLRKEGIEVELIRNPAVSRYDARDALDKEIPKFERDKPDFGTLFIGTNDSFRSRNLETFRADYVELLDRMQGALTKRSNLVVITIPKYADFPGIRGFGVTNEYIEQYNLVIREEAQSRNLPVVDLFLNEQLSTDEDFIADGIHPSARGVVFWHDAILPVVLKTLR